MTPELTQSQIAELVAQTTQYDPKSAGALFELLRFVVDPTGDKVRYALADEVMKQVVLQTPQFEEWYRSQVAA